MHMNYKQIIIYGSRSFLLYAIESGISPNHHTTIVAGVVIETRTGSCAGGGGIDEARSGFDTRATVDNRRA